MTFYDINHALSESFLTNKKVRGRIEKSINEDDWKGKEEDLKHLIKAFYRSTPNLWKRMVDYKWIVRDLIILNLDETYRIVDEERKCGPSI